MTLKLSSIQSVKARLEVLTGLHIGAGDLEMRIGGIDNPVIKDAYGDPYIPGSSLKGKMRSLLEWRSGALTSDKPLGKGAADDERARPILMLFGVGGGDAVPNLMPSRLSVADAPLREGDRSPARNAPLTEAKFENSINRIEGTATNPRQTERVVPGTSFDFSATIRVFKNDPDLVTLLLEGMALLEMDALGGSGSRGYGKVAFRDVTVDGEPCTLPPPFARPA
jgi:CRISPR-associated protein Csm3